MTDKNEETPEQRRARKRDQVMKEIRRRWPAVAADIDAGRREAPFGAKADKRDDETPEERRRRNSSEAMHEIRRRFPNVAADIAAGRRRAPFGSTGDAA